jgi:hypothetical protein
VTMLPHVKICFAVFILGERIAYIGSLYNRITSVFYRASEFLLSFRDILDKRFNFVRKKGREDSQNVRLFSNPKPYKRKFKFLQWVVNILTKGREKIARVTATSFLCTREKSSKHYLFVFTKTR